MTQEVSFYYKPSFTHLASDKESGTAVIFAEPFLQIKNIATN